MATRERAPRRGQVRLTKKPLGLSMKAVILCISIVSLLLSGCGSDPSGQYAYRPSVSIGDGLEVGTLAEVNIDQASIERAIDDIGRGKHAVHSMLIFRDGKLVLEEYFDGYKYKWDGPNYNGDWVNWTRSTLHVMQSVTKSIVSTCIGIAADKGYIDSVHQSIFDYLPEYQHLNTAGRDGITIEHLLTMTSGLEWDEWGASNTSLENDAIGLWFHELGPIPYALDRPLVSEPGTSFTYNGGGTDVLGEILRNATGMTIDQFAAKHLSEPLAIDSFNWDSRFENGVIDAAWISSHSHRSISSRPWAPRWAIGCSMRMATTAAWQGCTFRPVMRPSSAYCISTMVNTRENRSFQPIGSGIHCKETESRSGWLPMRWCRPGRPAVKVCANLVLGWQSGPLAWWLARAGSLHGLDGFREPV